MLKRRLIAHLHLTIGLVMLGATAAMWGLYAATGLGVFVILAILLQVLLMLGIVYVLVTTLGIWADVLHSRWYEWSRARRDRRAARSPGRYRSLGS